MTTKQKPKTVTHQVFSKRVGRGWVVDAFHEGSRIGQNIATDIPEVLTLVEQYISPEKPARADP